MTGRSIGSIPWLTATLRWLFLAGALVVIAVDSTRGAHSRFDLTSLALFISLIVLADLLLILLQALDAWPGALPAIGLAVDLLIAAGLYVFYGGAATPLLFIGLRPVVVAALQLDRITALAAAMLATVTYIAGAVLFNEINLVVFGVLATNLLLFLLAAGSLDLLAGQVRSHAGELRRQTSREEAHRVARARERARAIYDMASTLSATLNYEKVLETALDVCEVGLSESMPRGERLIGMVLLFQEDDLQIVASRHLTRTDSRVAISGEGQLIRQALKSAEPVLATDVTADQDLKQIVALQDAKSVVCLPLRAGFENYGVAVFGTPVPNFFGEEQLELFNAVANQATIALQNARLYQSLVEEKERIIEVDEEARKKLARDLHDGPTQNVAAIAMRTNFALRLIEREPAKAGDEMRKIEELARQTTREMRHMLFTLRPLVLESQGLTAALQQLCEKMHENFGLNVILEAVPTFEQHVDPAKQGVAFYIVEEALGNARKHSQAQHIWVRLGLRGDLFIIQIEDDGVGFDVAKVTDSYDSRGSLGMVNMRERAALINGKLMLESTPGKGTRITVAVPLTEAAHERLQSGETTSGEVNLPTANGGGKPAAPDPAQERRRAGR
jgi:signal transduction histidine kinase